MMNAASIGPRAASEHRGTIHVEETEVLTVSHHPADQHVLRLRSPIVARHARPGSFAHLRCHESLPMRRPFSIMNTDGEAGWFDILFKVKGAGTAQLARHVAGDIINTMAPIGTPFKLADYKRHALLIGGGVGIPPMVFLAKHIRRTAPETQALVLMGSEVPFPFMARPSRIMISDIPEGVIGTMPLLEDWGVACRLASLQAYPGCFDGFVTDLAAHWIEARLARNETDVEIFACGPSPMLKAVAELSRHYRLPCQISLEEYMACAVGGCAGCTVKVNTAEGPAMKRVCVDGPVFDAASVVFSPA
jgi:dihydroorotate dehydrogenase electron transfer subunit